MKISIEVEVRPIPGGTGVIIRDHGKQVYTYVTYRKLTKTAALRQYRRIQGLYKLPSLPFPE